MRQILTWMSAQVHIFIYKLCIDAQFPMVVGTPKIVPCHHLLTSFTIHLQMLKGEDDGMGIMAKVDVNVEVVGKMAKWMQMLLKGEDDDMGMMAKVDVNVEG